MSRRPGKQDANLYDLIYDHFSREELYTLCYKLGIDSDEFPIEKSGLIRALIRFCFRNGRLTDLIDRCKKERPSFDWPDLKSAFSEAELLGESPPAELQQEPRTVYVPAGEFLMGSPPGEGIPAYESPQHTIHLPAYRIGKHPVTNAQYAAYLSDKKGKDAPEFVGWTLGGPPPELLDHPVVGVSWFDALDYCEWLKAVTGKQYRLPSEAEWEKAARGFEGFHYPWGNEWIDGRSHVAEGGTAPVRSYPDGISPFGCQNMLGNILEWTNTLWGGDPMRSDFAYPYKADDRETIDPDLFRVFRIHRGGSYKDTPDSLRCSRRDFGSPDSKTPWRGFRVAIGL